MTRKELEIREQAVLCAYKYNNVDKGIDYVMQLYQRNIVKKLYRFRPPKQHEIDAIRGEQIYLCHPYVYKDLGDCEWIDDIEALVKYEVTIRSAKIYEQFKKQFTPEKYKEIVEKIQQNSTYAEMKKKARNNCLIACITDKMTNQMWEEYALHSEGICLEYDFEDVLRAITRLNMRFFPIRYVEDRNKTKDIQFGPKEYAENASEELMYRKYILSCLTKDKVPYAKESEWRVLCDKTDIPMTEKGKLFKFIRPNKIYLGKNISQNNHFEKEIISVANEYGISVVQI